MKFKKSEKSEKRLTQTPQTQSEHSLLASAPSVFHAVTLPGRLSMLGVSEHFEQNNFEDTTCRCSEKCGWDRWPVAYCTVRCSSFHRLNRPITNIAWIQRIIAWTLRIMLWRSCWPRREQGALHWKHNLSQKDAFIGTTGLPVMKGWLHCKNNYIPPIKRSGKWRNGKRLKRAQVRLGVNWIHPAQHQYSFLREFLYSYPGYI